MKKLRRILVVVSILFTACISAIGVYSSLDNDFIYKFGLQVRESGFFSGTRMGLLFGSLLFLIVVIAILFTFPRKDRDKESIRISNAGGTVSISAQTIESLAKLVASNTPNIYDIRTTVVDIDDKPTIEVRAKVPPTISIPAISAQLQDSIRNKIMETTGTDIENVKILIDGIIDSAKK
ncbi:MAG: alkaline shock response membrane anchor protein AmaP [Clostridia bacterium]|nr:alkaline shock response membrane anchor protein AmaP [Clostridia bacterium]